MSALEPTPDEAARTLAEANLRESQIRGADAQLAWILAILAAAAVGIGILMSVAPHAVGPAVGVLYVGAIVATGAVFFRIHAYSRAGVLVFSLAASTFAIWNALASAVSITTGWWSPTQPNFHFGVTEAIAVVPLLVGIWVLRRRRV